MNLALNLLYAAERTPAAEALVGERERLTFAHLRERAARVAGGLAARGVGAGDRVACVLANEPETVELYWGCQWLGACAVPLSHRISEPDLDYCISDCGATVVVQGLGRARGSSRVKHPGALDLGRRGVDRSVRCGRRKVPRSQRAERAGGTLASRPHGLRHGNRTLGVMPLYHTMGIHSLSRPLARRRLLRPQPSGSRAGARADRAEASTHSLPRADPLL